MLTSSEKYELSSRLYKKMAYTFKLGSVDDNKSFSELISIDSINETINSKNLIDNYIITSTNDDKITIQSIISDNILRSVVTFLNNTTLVTSNVAIEEFINNLNFNCANVYLKSSLDVDQNLTDIQKKSLKSKYVLYNILYGLLNDEFENDISSIKLRESIQNFKIHEFLKKFIEDNVNLTTSQLDILISNNSVEIVSQIKSNILYELSNPSFPSEYL